MCKTLHVTSDSLLMDESRENDAEIIARRLQQLPPQQFQVVKEIINSVLELSALTPGKTGLES